MNEHYNFFKVDRYTFSSKSAIEVAKGIDGTSTNDFSWRT